MSDVTEQKTDTSHLDPSKGLPFLKAILVKNLNIPSDALCRAFGVSLSALEEIKEEIKKQEATTEEPLSWDYVMAFDVGSEEKLRKPTKKERATKQDVSEFEDEWEQGMTQRKYFCQIILQTQKDLESARLSTKLFKSVDEKYAFLIVGLTESNLHRWADDRDTDLELNPFEACLEGRRRGFPLALRTFMTEQDDPGKCTLSLSQWGNMYCQYHPRAEQSIYRKYPRFPDDPNSKMTPFDEKTRLRIIYESIIEDKGEGGAEIEVQSHIASSMHPLIACFPLHNPKKLNEFLEKWVRNYEIRNCLSVPLEEIRDYFGEPTAFYYAFMMFYLRWLLWPTALGFIFFLAQLGYGRVDIPGLFILSLFVIFWCVAFVDFWIRTESRYRVLWGMTKFQTKAVARPEFKGEWQHDRVSGLWTEDYAFIYRLWKGSFVFSGLGVWMTGCVVSVIYVLLLRDADPRDLGLKIGLGILNGVMISLFDLVYRYVSQYGNEWENHRTEQDFQDALIYKSFIFKFFNSFSSLFYLSFMRPFVKSNNYYLQQYPGICVDCKDGNNNPTCAGAKESYSSEDYACCYAEDRFCTQVEVEDEINIQVLKDVQLQLCSLFLTAIVIQNLVEVLFPYMKNRLTRELEIREKQRTGQAITEKSEAEKQLQLAPNQNTIDDMSEMVIQFGYVTMFMIALPIIPLLSFINNVIELKVDAFKIVTESQRPHPNGSSGLGAWNKVLGLFSIIAVGTNVALITWRTQMVNVLLSTDPTMKWVFFTFVSIFLSILVGFEKWSIPDEPLEVTQSMERQRLIENVLVLGAHLEMDSDDPPKKEDDTPEFAFDPTKKFIILDDLPLIPMGDLTQLKNSSDQNAYIDVDAIPQNELQQEQASLKDEREHSSE